MPHKKSRHRPGEMCPDCHTVHTTQHGGPACVGHRYFDYPKGEPKVRLETPVGCRRSPSIGLSVCQKHGVTKKAKHAGQARAAVKVAKRDAEAVLAYTGGNPLPDPAAEIGRLAARAAALNEALGQRVNALDDVRYTGGLERDEDGELRGTGTEQIRGELQLYLKTLELSAKLFESQIRHTRTQTADETRAMLTQLGEALGIGRNQ